MSVIDPNAPRKPLALSAFAIAIACRVPAVAAGPAAAGRQRRKPSLHMTGGIATTSRRRSASDDVSMPARSIHHVHFYRGTCHRVT